VTKVRLLLLSIVAALAVGAVGAAAANAAEFKVCQAGGTEEYETNKCLAKKAGSTFSYLAVPAGGLNVEGTSGASKLESTILAKRTIIECLKDKTIGAAGTNKIEPAGASKGEIEYSECKLFIVNAEHKKELLAACTVPNIKFKFTDLLLVGNGAGPDESFEGTEAEETFVIIKIEGASCAAKGTYKVKNRVAGKPGYVGSAVEPTVGAAEHELIFTSVGSNIKLGPEPASFFSTEKVKLESGAAWYAE
jgi:hypothetical protein